jgi:hypothetical protein
MRPFAEVSIRLGAGALWALEGGMEVGARTRSGPVPFELGFWLNEAEEMVRGRARADTAAEVEVTGGIPACPCYGLTRTPTTDWWCW